MATETYAGIVGITGVVVAVVVSVMAMLNDPDEKHVKCEKSGGFIVVVDAHPTKYACIDKSVLIYRGEGDD